MAIPTASALSTDKIQFGTPTSTMAFGAALKSAPGTIEINFGVTFKQPPIVFLTPNWTGGVGYVETVVGVDKDKFRIASSNSSGDYYVNWLAIGQV